MPSTRWCSTTWSSCAPATRWSSTARCVEADGLEVDESLLTGESDPVPKAPGDEVLSGSFVVAGSGHVRATKVGTRRLRGQAGRGGPPLHAGAVASCATASTTSSSIVSWAMVPTADAPAGQPAPGTDDGWRTRRRTVAGVVAMVPEGLVLLTSVAFAVGVVRLGRRHVLVQELAAVEGLARVDVLCLDKTGTLTEGDIAGRARAGGRSRRGRRIDGGPGGAGRGRGEPQRHAAGRGRGASTTRTTEPARCPVVVPVLVGPQVERRDFGEQGVLAPRGARGAGPPARR